MAELTTDEVLEIALRLYHERRLTARQFDAWKAYRFDGMTGRDAARYLRDTYSYDISYVTVIADSRYAHEIVVQACNEAEEGRVRIGVTVAAGAETWFAPDPTLQTAARRTRAVNAKKKSLSRDLPAICGYS